MIAGHRFAQMMPILIGWKCHLRQGLIAWPTMINQENRKPRTLSQNAALHLYYRMLAEALNDAGLDARKTLKPEIEIPWTPEMIKDLLWRPIQEAMTGKHSTTELNTVDPSEIYQVLDRHLGEKFSLHVPFPSYEGDL